MSHSASAPQASEKSEAKTASPDRDGHPLWGSYGNLLGIQTLNAFNDNAVKFLLIGLAATTIGEEVYKNIAFALNALAFIALAPLAGWCSDFFSKKSVLIAMLWAQLGAMALIALGPLLGHWMELGAYEYKQPNQTAWQALFGVQMLPIVVATLGFFLLCVQSAFFSPAKLGIVVELVGKKRLGFANSWMQMLAMVAIILGGVAGSQAFAKLAQGEGIPWLASVWPLLPLAVVSFFALLSGYAMERTPRGNAEAFSLKSAFSHKRDLGLLFGQREQARVALMKGWTWFVAVFVNLATLQLVRKVLGNSPEASKLISSEAAILTGIMGIGIILGSLLVAWLNRRGNELRVISWGALFLAVFLLLLALQEPVLGGSIQLSSLLFWISLAALGVAAALLLIPLNAHLQQIAAPERRATIIAGSSLTDNVFIVSAAGIQLLLGKGLGWSVAWQFIALALATFFVALCSMQFFGLRSRPMHQVSQSPAFSHAAVVALTRPIFVLIWRIRSFGTQRIPQQGGVLLTPNHVTFFDAFVLSAACPRPVRFVIEEKYYTMWWAHWFLKAMGCIPITQRKAKDALKTVAKALKDGDCVCLFPEGELTRDGQLRELRRGVETIARLAQAPVIAVCMSGLFRSILGHSGGGMLWKRPSFLKVSVSFAKPLMGKEIELGTIRKRLNRLRALNYRLRPNTTPDSHPNPEKVVIRQPEKPLEIPAATAKRKMEREKKLRGEGEGE